MPLKVLSKAAPWAQVVPARSSWSLLRGFRLRSTPCSCPQAASTVATRKTFRLPPQGFHRVWILHPVRARRGRADTVLQSVLTVEPVASIVIAWSVEVGVLPTLGSGDSARMNRPEHPGTGRFFATAGVPRTPTRRIGADTTMAARARGVGMMPPSSAIGPRGGTEAGAADHFARHRERMASAMVAPGLYGPSLHDLASHFDGGASSLHPAAGPPPYRTP